MKVLIGVAVAAVAPIGVAGVVAGVQGSSTKPSPAQAMPVQSPPAAPLPAKSSPAPQPAANANLDQDGDPDTPCVLTYTPTSDGKGTAARFALGHGGDVIAHLNGPDGMDRYTATATTGELRHVFNVPLAQVHDGGAILQDADGTRHVCSIHAGP